MTIKKVCAIALVSAMAACMMVACGGSAGSAVSNTPTAAPTATPEPTPTPEPPYKANPLTGEPVDADYIPERITGIMINNLSDARPQRGLSKADMLMEIKVEGGITRFMAMYTNYQDAGEVGPIRSGRDQFFRLLLPFQGLYVHEGQSVVMQQYAKDYDYTTWNINNGAYGYRDLNRVNWRGRTHSSGLAIEHTMYTNSDNITQYIEKNDVDMEREYTSTFFKFLDYRYDTEPRVIENGEAAEKVKITHSASYKTRFNFNESTGLYDMQQYNSIDKQWHDTIDETNNELLSFTNLVVLFTDIHTYPGHEAKDLQYVDFDFGGVGFYFTGGKAEKIFWQKGTPMEALRLYYPDANGKCGEEMVDVNIGKCYLTVVDLDEYENGFEYSGPESAEASSGAETAETAESAVEGQTAEEEVEPNADV